MRALRYSLVLVFVICFLLVRNTANTPVNGTVDGIGVSEFSSRVYEFRGYEIAAITKYQTFFSVKRGVVVVIVQGISEENKGTGSIYRIGGSCVIHRNGDYRCYHYNSVIYTAQWRYSDDLPYQRP